ncbi:hypothetical protein JHK87_031543 [Glycine soja]|nr:hypothetical protein JHK87_031543 [Glycine soja]
MLQVNADLDMELNPQAQPWPYQAKSLNRMFGNGLMSSRPEIGNKSNTQNNAENEGFAESQGNEFIPAGFPVGPWDDSAIMSDNMTGLKRFRDEDVKPFSGLNAPESQVEYHWTKVKLNYFVVVEVGLSIGVLVEAVSLYQVQVLPLSDQLWKLQ